MKKLLFLLVLALPSYAEDKIIRDPNGRIVATESHGVIRDATGKTIATESKAGGTTVVRDANGKIIGTETKK